MGPGTRRSIGPPYHSQPTGILILTIVPAEAARPLISYEMWDDRMTACQEFRRGRGLDLRYVRSTTSLDRGSAGALLCTREKVKCMIRVERDRRLFRAVFVE